MPVLKDCEPDKDVFKVIGETYSHEKMDADGIENYVKREQSLD